LQAENGTRSVKKGDANVEHQLEGSVDGRGKIGGKNILRKERASRFSLARSIREESMKVTKLEEECSEMWELGEGGEIRKNRAKNSP